MRTNSSISAIALAAALLAAPQATQAAGLGLGLSLGGSDGVNVDVGVGTGDGLGVDAGVSVGGDDGLNVDAGANVGGSQGGIGVNAGLSSGDRGSDDNLVDVGIGTNNHDSGGSLVDVNLGSTGQTGPHGGSVISLGGGSQTANTGGTTSPAPVLSNNLLNGGIRIGSLGTGERNGALLGLIDSPNLANIDLDATVDDRRVSIISAVDLLGTEDLIDLEAHLDLGGEGRNELLDALTNSNVLGSVLGNEGIDLSDVLAVQVAENGATEVIVLDGVTRVALLGDDGNLADLSVGDLATLDIDLLSDEELAQIDLALLPDDLRTEVQLRLLGLDGDGTGIDLADLSAGELADLDIDLLTDEQLARIDLDLLPEDLRTEVEIRLLGGNGDLADLTVDELANLNIDLLSDEELAEINLDLLPEELQTAVQIRLLGIDGDIADISVAELAQINLSLLDDGEMGTESIPGDGTGGGDDGTGGNGGGTGGGDTGGSDDGGNTGGNGGGSTGGGTGTAPLPVGVDETVVGSIGTMPGAEVEAGFTIAALDCGVGVLALAQGLEASPSTIASADSLELVSIDGCARSLVSPDAESIRAAIEDNPAINQVLDNAQIPLDQVIGATIQAGTLTVFIEPAAAS